MPQPNAMTTDAPSQIVNVYCPACRSEIHVHFVWDRDETVWAMSGAIAGCPLGCGLPPETTIVLEEIAECKAAEQVVDD